MFEIAGNNKEWIEGLSKFAEFTRPDLMSIIKDEDMTVLRFKAPCKFLQDKRCTIYEERPEICRNFLCRKAKEGRENEIECV